MNQFPTNSPGQQREIARAQEPKLDVGTEPYVSPAARNARQSTEEAMRGVPAERAYRNIASNFYWIAGLSMVNSLINVFSGNVQFPMGLEIAQVVDAIAFMVGRDIVGIKTAASVVGLLVNAGICGLIVLFGYLTSKYKDWPLVTGMILYAVDALLMLFFQDWIGFGFHVFFLWQIWMSYKIIRMWKKTNPRRENGFPQDIRIA